MKKPNVYWIDLFAGAGGTSTGLHLANQNVIACVNHDATAIQSHCANHPNTRHFVEDIKDFKVVLKLKLMVKLLRMKEPDCIINIWASLECTNYSKAKGGLPRDGDSRTLAHHLPMYLEHLKPNGLYIENVVEFMSWGALDENGRPIHAKKGEDYLKWIDDVKSYEFDFDYKILNSADFGAYTSRSRYFGIFKKKGQKIYFPEPTHFKITKKSQMDLFDAGKQRHKAVRDCLDLENKGRSIFGRKKDLSPKTYARILEGCKKFIPEGQQQFLTSYYGNGQAHSTDNPCPTITTKDRFALNYILYDYSKLTVTSLDDPAGTITTVPKHNLVSTEWITDTQYGRVGQGLEQPCFTLIARMDKKPPYFVKAEHGNFQIEIYDTDIPIIVEIKQFMQKYGITDIFMRMLEIPELKRIQGFGDKYILRGTKQQQKKQIGNAVVPLMAKEIAEVN